MSWINFWLASLFITIALFVIVSIVISIKGVGELRQLFATLKQQGDQGAEMKRNIKTE